MLFNSFGFIFLFLPLCLALFTLANRWRGVAGGVFAIVAGSLVFYASWDARFLLLLLPSVGLNYLAGRAIASALEAGATQNARFRLGVAVSGNLLVLGWFKYVGFLAASLNTAFGANLPLLANILPLGISFFTFEQIGYLVDVRRGSPVERNLARYALFVMFFPRLVAGPILRVSELLPQIPRSGRMVHGATDIAVGGTLFAVGLAKKAFLADGIAPYANSIFAAAGHDSNLTLAAAWSGTLAYTLQIYFDFSGYSDMAIGAARMFGLRFPMNFNSPYKALSIVEFWRRWHMTLSRFLRDYLYISLGGNRRGQVMRFFNLFITMLLGGLWHGANWTFVAWGALHGIYLIINHGWSMLGTRVPYAARLTASRAGRLVCWMVTMLGVVVGWVFFRAPDFGHAQVVLAGMFGLHGMAGGAAPDMGRAWLWIVSLGMIALAAPNSQEILADWKPVLEPLPDCGEGRGWRWQPSVRWGIATACIALIGMLSISNSGEFLYWQF